LFFIKSIDYLLDIREVEILPVLPVGVGLTGGEVRVEGGQLGGDCNRGVAVGVIGGE